MHIAKGTGPSDKAGVQLCSLRGVSVKDIPVAAAAFRWQRNARPPYVYSAMSALFNES